MGSSSQLANTTLPGSASELSEEERREWWLRQIERVFQKFEDWYGAKWATAYGAFPRERVKRTWADDLAGFAAKPECIAQAMNAQRNSQFPPTLPEFLTLCNEAAKRIGDAGKAMLPYRPTEEDQRRAQEAIATASATLKRKTRDGIDEHWATHPRSIRQLKMIFYAALNDPRFKPCIAKMVDDGICTTDGRLLKRYANTGTWEKV